MLAHRAARERIERTGAEFVEFRRSVPDMDLSTRETDSLRDWEARTRFGAGMRVLKNGLLPFVVNTSRECAELLDGWPANVLVMDWMLTGAAVAAEGAGVPAVAAEATSDRRRAATRRVGATNRRAAVDSGKSAANTV